VLQDFKLEKLTIRKRDVGCRLVVWEFEFVFLTAVNPNRNGWCERISSSEAMIHQWTSVGSVGQLKQQCNVEDK
jgi:hypothetical protein